MLNQADQQETKSELLESSEKERKSTFFSRLVGIDDKKTAADFANYLDYMDYRTKNRKQRRLRRRITGGVCAAAFVACVGLGGWGIYHLVDGGPAYAIQVNDRQVAVVQDEGTADHVINAFLEKKSKAADGLDVTIAERVDVVPLEEKDVEVMDPDAAKVALSKAVTPIVSGVTIQVDGEPVVNLADETEANKALQYVKDSFTPEDTTLEVVDSKFQEDVQVVASNVPVDSLVDKQEAKLILKGTTATESYLYVAKAGDSLADIAKSENVTESHILAFNPTVDFDNLEEGQQVKIKAEEPKVNVMTVLEKTREAVIPYKTVYKTDRSAAAGTQTVAQEGQNGKEEVVLKMVRVNGEEYYRERIDSTVLEVAVEEVVVKGAAPSTSSRSSGGSVSVSAGSGGMAWPTTAHRISSYYGSRSRGYHTGLDIDGNTGDPVWAAKAGTVVSAGWAGGYGYCVVVNHGGGVKTRYAHMSSISVKSGQSVSAGTILGKVGSTGNSTGSHLHFEVIVNGSTRNPLSYL